MHYSEIQKWITQDENRKRMLISIQQPMTAKQLSRQTAISIETCSYLLGKFAALQLCVCLNPEAGNSRLYWITDLGRKIQDTLQEKMNLPPKDISFHSVNWALYGWVCYSHRSVVLRALTEPMQPCEIRRKIRHRFPSARISANNVCDIIRLFEKQGIVRKVFVKKKAHSQYELTETGLQFQILLNRAETGFIL
jgi:DNA-binding HxlR family transcriptional regulator